MKKLEGILTVFGVFVIIGLPLFLMLADIKNMPTNGGSSDLIMVQSYAEDIVMHVDDYEESYDVLDGEEPRTINNEIDLINDEVVPLGLSPLIVPKEETISEVENTVYTLPVFVEIEDLSDGLVTDDGEELIMIDFRDMIPDEVLPQGLDIDKPTYEEVGDIENETEEFIELVDYDMPEALVLEDHEDLSEEIFDDDLVEWEGEEALASPEGLVEEIEYVVEENENEEITISDDNVPEALLGSGAQNINVETVEDNGIVTHNVTMEYVSYDELGNEIITYVAFSY